jgi:hypothetical protein
MILNRWSLPSNTSCLLQVLYSSRSMSCLSSYEYVKLMIVVISNVYRYSRKLWNKYVQRFFVCKKISWINIDENISFSKKTNKQNNNNKKKKRKNKANIWIYFDNSYVRKYGDFRQRRQLITNNSSLSTKVILVDINRVTMENWRQHNHSYRYRCRIHIRQQSTTMNMNSFLINYSAMIT